MGNPHAIFWVEDVNAYDLGRFGPLGKPPDLPGARQHHARAYRRSRSHRDPHLGAGRGTDQGLRLGGLRDGGGRRAAAARQSKVKITLPGGDLGIEWRESDDHVLMTGTAAFEYEGRFDPALFASVA